jgi:hypothetical protein
MERQAWPQHCFKFMHKVQREDEIHKQIKH